MVKFGQSRHNFYVDKFIENYVKYSRRHSLNIFSDLSFLNIYLYYFIYVCVCVCVLCSMCADTFGILKWSLNSQKQELQAVVNSLLGTTL